MITWASWSIYPQLWRKTISFREAEMWRSFSLEMTLKIEVFQYQILQICSRFKMCSLHCTIKYARVASADKAWVNECNVQALREKAGECWSSDLRARNYSAIHNNMTWLSRTCHPPIPGPPSTRFGHPAIKSGVFSGKREQRYLSRLSPPHLKTQQTPAASFTR